MVIPEVSSSAALATVLIFACLAVGHTELAFVVFDKEATLTLSALFGVATGLTVEIDCSATQTQATGSLDVVTSLAGLALIELVSASLAVLDPMITSQTFAIFRSIVGLANLTVVSACALHAAVDDLTADTLSLLLEVELVNTDITLISGGAPHTARYQ